MEIFKTIKLKGFDYRVNRLLILVAFIVIASLLLIILVQDNFSGENKYYSECPSNTKDRCFNAFYNSNLCSDGSIDPLNPLCTVKEMFPGETLGDKPSFLVTYFPTISSIILLITLLINNFVYNKGFFKYLKEGFDNE